MLESIPYIGPYIGEVFSLLVALIWAIAVILFKKSGETAHPIILNIFKNVLALVLFVITIMIIGVKANSDTPLSVYLLLFASGALGIGIADTLFFYSLNLLGASMSAIVDCMYSPFIIILSVFFIGESMTNLQIVGVVIILSAVFTATSKNGRANISRRNLIWGVLCGALAMATMAIGIVMVKPILSDFPVLWVIEIRLIGGIAVMALVWMLHPKRAEIGRSIMTKTGWVFTLSGSFIGAYLATLVWMLGMKYTQASISAALNQTSNIFIFIFAAMFLHEPLNKYRIAALILGMTGVMFVISG